MNNKYLIYEKFNSISAYLVQAVDEEAAWACYLKEAWGYLKHTNGTFYKEELNNDLEGVLNTYNLILAEDGEVTEQSGIRHPTLQDAFRVYHVFPQQDGTYISHGLIFANSSEALRKIFPDYCRFEIQEFAVNEFDHFQSFHLSDDDMKYWEDSPRQVIANVIAHEHEKQADRYEAAGDILGAIEELKKIHNLNRDHKYEIAAFQRTAYFYGFLNQWNFAEIYYQKALDISTSHDNQAQIAQCLGEALEKQADYTNALKYCQLSVKLDLKYVDLSDPDIQQRVNHISKINSEA